MYTHVLVLFSNTFCLIKGLGDTVTGYVIKSVMWHTKWSYTMSHDSSSVSHDSPGGHRLCWHASVLHICWIAMFAHNWNSFLLLILKRSLRIQRSVLDPLPCVVAYDTGSLSLDIAEQVICLAQFWHRYQTIYGLGHASIISRTGRVETTQLAVLNRTASNNSSSTILHHFSAKGEVQIAQHKVMCPTHYLNTSMTKPWIGVTGLKNGWDSLATSNTITWH